MPTPREDQSTCVAKDGAANAGWVPRLASGVSLVGEQAGTGFSESQWLAERDGRYVQLSELLYRVLECVDGQRSLDSIAAGTTDSTPWTVTAAQVRELLVRKLIPIGLVAPLTGEASVGSSEPRPRSPLRVKLRRVLIGRRLLDPITDVLQVFYSTPLLVGLLSLIAFTYGWLYLDHGIGGAVSEVILQPGLLLAAGALFVVTTLIHELGHAAALRYGGGRARGIGAGVYLIYPVFFTDTTDAYRLGRWARVRIDLGGFYFQSIAGVALIGLALLSGWQWLLIAVFLINLETLRQLLFPFVRLDGYWLFADLTGVPDFFSQLKPVLRSFRPRDREIRPRLPALKPLPKVVFLGWAIVTASVLSFLMVELALQAPHLIATAWDSILALKGTLVSSLAAGDVASASAALAQLLLLTLPALASIVLSLVLATWLASIAWRRRRARARTRVGPAAAPAPSFVHGAQGRGSELQQPN
jgi:putative peptide zinc metalloprotease protein